MTEQRTIDESTGLPVLPPGQYWSVTKWVGEYSGTHNILELRARAPKWYNRNITRLVIDAEIDDLSRQGILETALSILNLLDFRAEQDKFYGDYPPKSLVSDA